LFGRIRTAFGGILNTTGEAVWGAIVTERIHRQNGESNGSFAVNESSGSSLNGK
jgi:hypothetical protein